MTNILVPELFGFAKFFVFAFSAPTFSVGETLHVAYKKHKIKRKFTFFVNTKYIQSRELKTSEFSIVLRTPENSNIFNTLDEIYLVFTSKSKYPLFIAIHWLVFVTSRLNS